MARKNYTVEQIIVKLREVELLCNQGNDLPPTKKQSTYSEKTNLRIWLPSASKMRQKLKKACELTLSQAFLFLPRITLFSHLSHCRTNSIMSKN